MRKLSENQEIITISIVILIVIGMCFKLYFSSLSFSCDDCIISFKDRKPLESRFREQNISAKELYQGFINGTCPIYWDKVNGYIKNG